MLIAGNGPLNLQLACELLAGGVTVAAVVEAAPRPGAAAGFGSGGACCGPRRTWLREGLATSRRLRRAGVPVLWGSRVVALEGDRSVSPRCAWPRRRASRRIAADVVALNMGFQPEVGLARALGVPHRFVDVGIGHLATETDEDGRTAVAGVFAVGDGASLGGARVALARGRLAGLAAAARSRLFHRRQRIGPPRIWRGRENSRPRCGGCSRRRGSTPPRSPTTPSSAAARR